MSIELIPHSYYILCRKGSLQRDSSIIRPENASSDLVYGEVLSTGPECITVTMGDKCLYLPDNAIGIEDPNESGQMLHIVAESAVFAHYEVHGEEVVEA